MPIQSRRISLSALGVEKSPGLQPGNHLRIGFDPRMGFPSCGFNLFVRRHITGAKHIIDFPRLFDENLPALLRHGYLQDGVSIFHPRKPLPAASPSGGVLLSDQRLGISFRQSPFAPDSNPKVCEIRISIQSTGTVVAKAFDDRYNNAEFPKVLVAHQQRVPQPLPQGEVLSMELRADLISLIEISAPPGSQLLSFEYVEVSDTAWSGLVSPAEEPWQLFREMPLLLPTPQPAPGNHSTYPTCASLSFTPPADAITEKLPVNRLSSGFVASTGPDDVNGEYPDLQTHLRVYLGPDPDRPRFKELDATLRALEAVPPGDQLNLQLTLPGELPDESSTFAPLPLVLTGAVDPHFARLAGLATIHTGQSAGSPLDYKVVARWNNTDHAWITHDVFPGRDGDLNPPAPPDATAVLNATRPGGVKTDVELTWHAADEIARLDRANQYAGFHVFRRASGSNTRVRLTESKDELAGIVTPDLLLLAEVQGDEPVPAPSADVAHYVDRPPAYGQYDYGIQAEDLFGRRSKIVWKTDVEVPVLIDPSPISNLYAFYRDTADPAQADLEIRAQTVLAATGQSNFAGRALLLEFRYPKASIDAISGDLHAFHVAYRHGRPNEFLGLLSTASIVGSPPPQSTAPVPADVEFSTTTPVPAAIDGFGGERSRGILTSHAEFFAVESATRLGEDTIRLRVRARRDYLPQPGEAALSIGSGNPGVTPHPLYLSPRDPAAWSGFDLRHPHGPDDQGTLAISASSNAVLEPLPVALLGDQVVVSRVVVPPENVAPGETPVPEDWLYRIVVKDVNLPLPPGLSEYPGSVTVHVVSGANRRSELPAPAFVKRRLYGAPPPLTELATADFVTATRPDFEGRIGIWLTWPKLPGVERFKIYRVDVPKLLNNRHADPLLAGNLLESEPDRAQVKLLGGQLASIIAFTLVTPVPIRPETDAGNPGRHLWIDRVSAPAGLNYLYRIQPISGAGEESTWPADAGSPNEDRDRCILVLQKNRDLHIAPAIYELDPRDRAIGVVVRRPLAQTITGLRIFKTDVPSNAVDVRRMTLIHGTIPFNHPRIESLPARNEKPARLLFVDEKVRIGTAYFYRVLYVDEFGNQSQASEPMAATPRSLAPPAPPSLTVTRTAAATVQLSWSAAHNEGQVKVQRKRSGESQWVDIFSGWHAPTDTAVDTAAGGIVAHRLLLRDPKGRFVFSAPLVTEA